MTTTEPNEYIVLSKSELKIREWEIVLTWMDVEELLEHEDVYIKLLNKWIHKIQADLWNLLYAGRESEAYIWINTLKEQIKSWKKMRDKYKSHLQQIEKEKEQLLNSNIQ